MKLSFILVTIASLNIYAIGFSQSISVQNNITNISIKEVLKSIEAQGTYRFFYSDDFNVLDKKVSINAQDADLKTVLDQIFRDTPASVEYMEGNIVIITPFARQGITVTGTVFDNGKTMPGVNVFVKETTIGVVTDSNGKYSITVPDKNSVLVFSFMGYLTHELTVNDQKIVDVAMNEDTREIEEVVVVGYGMMKKQNLTGSIASVNFDDAMNSRPTTNLASAISGLTAGLTINQSSSAPGDERISLRVRGVGTLSLDTGPLVLIDGVFGNIQDVNPNDVENVSILKDAASSSIYGSRAANGVILITTKRGGTGKVTVNYNGYVGQQSAANMIDFISDYPTHMELQNEAAINSIGADAAYFDQNIINEWREKSKTDPINYPNTDWFREMLQPSTITEHNLSVRGGGEKANFMMSLGYLDNKGIIDNADYKKYSFRLNADSKVNDWLSVGGNVFGYWSDRGPVDISQFFSQMLMTNPGILPKTDDGRYGGSLLQAEIQKAYNPRAYVDNSIGNYGRQYVGVKFFTKINFLKYLEFETSFAGNYDNREHQLYYKPVSIWNTRTNVKLYDTYTINSLENRNDKYYSTLVNMLLRFNYSINQSHHIAALAGFDQEYLRMDGFSARNEGFPFNVIHVLNAGTDNPVVGGTATDYALRSYFGRINYNYRGKYLLEANARYDGSSRFRNDLRWGFFPSFSVGWRMSEEAFFEPIQSVVNNLKLRASWGKLGNNRIGDYEYQSTYATQSYSFGGTIVQGVAPTELANGKVAWEATTISNIGLDFGFFRNSLTLSVDIFNKITDDILVALPVPGVLGNISPPHQNAAKVRNKGFETQVNYFGKIGKDFSYSVGGNMSFVNNEVLRYMGEGVINPLSGGNTIRYITEGQAIGAYYVREVDHIVQDQSEIDNLIADGYTFTSAVSPKPGDFLFKNHDPEGDKILGNDDDRVFKGSPIPKMTYGINLSAAYKGFDIYVLGQGLSGYDTYYGGDAFNTYDLHQDYIVNSKVLNRWTAQNKSTKYPRLTVKDPNNTAISDYWLQSAAFFRIKSIQVGYTVPKNISSKIYLSRLRIYTGLENFFTFTGYDGFDPENVGVVYPTMKQWIMGLNVTF